MRTITDEELKGILEKHEKWVHGDCARADLSGVDLRGADLRKVNLCRANLRYADLCDAWLQYADLRKANLSLANLYQASLQESNLFNADLSYANLCRADLTGVNLQNTKLEQTILDNANLKCVARPWLIIADHLDNNSQTLYFADIDVVLCGCWNTYRGGTLSEFKTRIVEHRYGIRYLSAIKMFESMREAYLESAVEKKSNE